jgi:glutamate synthase (NADPH/NADH) small chain
MELGEPDAERPPPPGPRPGSEFVLPANVVIIGVGTTANPLIQSTTPDLKTNKRNYIVADPEPCAPPSAASLPAATSSPAAQR